jgi:hypothetical protein
MQRDRCKAKAKSGKPCRAAATASGLCFFHANPNKASELGRIGGKRNRRDVARDPDPLPSLDSARAVRDTVARLIADVYSGKVQPRVAASLAPLLNLQLRVIDTTDLELRISKLAEIEAASVRTPDSVARRDLHKPGERIAARNELTQPEASKHEA